MSLATDLKAEVDAIFASQWEEQKAQVFPDASSLRLDNHAKDLEKATVLYADLNGSTSMVDQKSWSFSAEVYKAYLRCAARIITSENGNITAYDGDRIMAVFVGEMMNTRAVRAGMKIHNALQTIVNPSLKSVYKSTDFVVEHVIGIDTSQLRAARIGVRGYNDLVWIGRAANYAAKLTSLPGRPIWITGSVYNVMHDDVKIHNKTKTNMWEARLWTSMKNLPIYCTDFGYVV